MARQRVIHVWHWQGPYYRMLDWCQFKWDAFLYTRTAHVLAWVLPRLWWLIWNTLFILIKLVIVTGCIVGYIFLAFCLGMGGVSKGVSRANR